MPDAPASLAFASRQHREYRPLIQIGDPRSRSNRMVRPPIAAPSADSPIPLDDPTRALVAARSDAASLPHVGIVGDTYTILLAGRDTAGRFTLIDMHVPPGGGPGPHRHDFEETFSVLDGEIEVTCRGEKSVASAGDTVNVPANAPHWFHNSSSAPARLLCICAPAGQEAFFLAIGVPLPTRTAAPPPMDEAAMQAFRTKAAALAPRYRTELLAP
jgi:quercetin dioxygenase-like cupin family protein